MTLKWTHSKPRKANINCIKLTRIQSLGTSRSTGNKDNNKLDPQSYWDTSSQQNLIGQDPTPHRSTPPSSHLSASKALVLAWRSQLAQSASSVRSSKASTIEGAIKRAPASHTSVAPLLHNQPSMSFPLHLRSQSQPLSHQKLARNSILFPKMESTMVCHRRQPWWDNATMVPGIETKSVSNSFPFESRSLQAGKQIFYSLDAVVRTSSTSTVSTLFVSEEKNHIAADTSTSSDDESYITCPCVEGKVDCSDSSSSSPTLNDQQGSSIIDYSKDSCQSPLLDIFAFPFPETLPNNDDFPDQSYSVEDMIHQADEIVAAKETQEKMDEIVGEDRLRQRESGTPPPESKVEMGPSLPEFLDEIHNDYNQERVVYGDESFGSSSLGDDEEEDSFQICHAWRESIAFAGLGASLANDSIQGKFNQVSSQAGQIHLAAKRKPSKVSLKTLNLDTIQETSVDLLQQASDSDVDPLNHPDICAHLLRRAKEDKTKDCQA